MSLNIKDPEAHRLAQELARVTGQSMTRAVTEALRDRLKVVTHAKGRASLEELMAIARQSAALVKGPYLDHADLLYDENGLPK